MLPQNLINKARLYGISSIIVVSFCVVGLRLLFIQVIEAPKLADLSRSQHTVQLDIVPERGEIRDRLQRPLALNLRMYSLYANPERIRNAQAAAQALAPLTGIPYETLLEKLQRKLRFIWLARELDEETAAHVLDLKIPGIGYLREPRRFYPNGDFASHLIGCVGLDDEGLEGLELQFDDDLKGRPGWESLLRDAKRRLLPSHQHGFSPAVDGYHVVATIDMVIQHIVEKEIDKAMESSNAKAACVIVMDPHTGEILALANRPSYDPNDFTLADRDAMRNRVICDVLEPGSCFKMVTAAAAIEEKVIEPNELIDCENGSFRVSSHTLHDHRPHGKLTFREVIQLSSNIGTHKIAARLGNDTLYKYIRAFGFGEKTGVALPGEINGIVHKVANWSKVSIATIPMGQGIGVTPLQLACMVSTIANGGMWVKPKVVLRTEDSNHQVVHRFDEVVTRRVISAETAQEITETLIGVVTSGTGKRAKVPGYTVAGKTGTAQKVEPHGGYSHKRFIASFVGFAPARNPRLTVIVIFDEPYPRYFGGTISAPVFSAVVSQSLRYLHVPTEEPDTEFTLSIKG